MSIMSPPIYVLTILPAKRSGVRCVESIQDMKHHQHHIDLLTGPSTQAVLSWSKLLISTIRHNPNQEYGVSLIHPIAEENATDLESAAIHRVLAITTRTNIVKISLDEHDSERHILSRLKSKRDNIDTQIVKGKMSPFDGVAELKDEAVALFEKYYREPWVTPLVL
ncbi:hypothetical protein F5884DRAFT_538134 [Xylogone sp. PMI_703]|nr:hypothetical protein F5884DRAFT_538134 [Xylogone sp. PMI_703]